MTFAPPVRLLLLPVVEDDKLGRRKHYLFPSVQVFVFRQVCVKVCQIQEHPQRKVGAVGGLVLIQGEPGVDHKGQVIFDGHVDGVLQRVDAQRPGILILFSAYRIIDRVPAALSCR